MALKLNRFSTWLKTLFTGKEKAVEISVDMKREMCACSIQHGVCPHDCDRCAWNTLGGD